MDDKQIREHFDTGMTKIKHEIKSRLVPHGLYATVTNSELESSDRIPAGSTIEMTVKGRLVARSFDRQQIESCRLRVGGDVLLGIISMIDEVSV